MRPLARIALLSLGLLAGACRSAPYETHRLSPRHREGGKDGPRVLVVVAHPDDEIACAGTIFKTATYLGGTCDVCVVTNGEGGYKYSTLAERLYGLELTDERVGRASLPRIRSAELRAGLEILGARNLFLLGQTDHRYTRDVEEILGRDARVWDLERVSAALAEILERGAYDFVLTLAPTEGTHGHHKAATLLALQAVSLLEPAARPAALCVRGSARDEPVEPPGLEGYPLTTLRPGAVYTFDRTQGFGYRQRLDYRIVASWAIAEHKSQGTMQLYMNKGELENYFLFDVSAPDGTERAAQLFDALGGEQFPAPVYADEPAGAR